ncbi:MAG TPA: thiol:disulfide interchange protein DsbA/DsbL [Rhodanobacteraceae bacterium]|jgi:thiol:disulfide interchange protein DsbA|nr:thiol:disulfide interchange protein DsbA/DsbL [Rhodanobacteraceae bacterium]
MFKRTVILLCGLLLTTACSAQNAAAPYTDGDQYVTIATPQRLDPNDGKVEVVEVFSYACIHCAHFAPYAEKLRTSLPAGVSFHFVPASFSAEWEPYARAFYAARQLGVLEQTHLALFREKFEQHYPLNSLDDLASFYAAHGTTEAAFLKAANSPRTNALLEHDFHLLQAWGIEGTPTIVVDGKYRSANIRNYDELVALTRWLVQRELKSKGG